MSTLHMVVGHISSLLSQCDLGVSNITTILFLELSIDAIIDKI